jgi:chromosome segregation ATPase
MGVVLGGKIVEGSVVDVPKFLTKSADKQRDAIVERLADVERQAARMERQIKDALGRERKANLVAEAMRRTLTRRVAKLEGSLNQVAKDLSETTERLKGLEHGA